MKRVPDRNAYLENFWATYPAAEAGWKFRGRLSNKRSSLAFDDEVFSLSWPAEFESYLPMRSPGVLHEGLFVDGDWVVIEGVLQNETIDVRRASLAAPRLRAPLGNPFVESRLSAKWSSYMREVRAYFLENEFIEALTPTLVPSPGTEPFLEPFTTKFEVGKRGQEFFLPTSPEFHLKKMLASGEPRVFEVKTCFRNGEIGPHHQPEFQMLEWYRAFSNLDAIADDCEKLIERLAVKFAKPCKVQRTTIAELFRTHVNFDLKPDSSREDLVALATSLKISISENDDFNDLFFRIFLEKIERDLGKDSPLIVRGYPPSQAALSRIGPDGFADRFEIYWAGIELANAFHELNDPFENEKRFEQDAEKSRELGRRVVPRDRDLIEAIYAGLPPSGGIALGLDRLFMVLFGVGSIEEARAFPIKG